MWDELKKKGLITLKGIGEYRVRLLKILGIETAYDLIFYFPRTYKIRLRPVKISNIKTGLYAIAGIILKKDFSTPYGNYKKRYLVITVSDNSGSVKLIAFQRRALFLNSSFKKGDNVYVEGHFVKEGDILQSTRFDIEKDTKNRFSILPVYPLKEGGVGQKFLRNIIHFALSNSDFSNYGYSVSLFKRAGLKTPDNAIKGLHFPDSLEDAEKSRKTFAFLKLIEWKKSSILERRKRMKYYIKPVNINLSKFDFLYKLPYKLTTSQIDFLTKIKQDLSFNYPFERLLQGEVGTGKTIVAITSIIMALENGGQGAFVVPTEILAQQIFWNYKEIIEKNTKLKTAVLYGGLSEKDKNNICDMIQDGKIDIVFGTHSLFSEKVYFKDLRVLVIDEEHRFGVNQKLKLLLNKGSRPHLVVMTATPIPRSCAIVLYGGMDISFLLEQPFGQRNVKTLLLKRSSKKKLFEGLKREINKGRSVYYICPLIEEMENKSDVANVIERTKEIISCGFKANCLYSRLSTQEKIKVLDEFKKKEIDILVSTTVIEVGLDIHNAGIIVIENPERFGMAQLHQLRGRVGRDGRLGYCVLFYDDNLNYISLKRLRAFARQTSGYNVSMEDLKLRGPGEIEGIKQTGFHFMYPFEPIKDDDLMKTLDTFNDEEIVNVPPSYR
ncbi:MAG: ATP-dependent DNA helicase RecG [Candidatus Hydrogenedentota bacterium]